MMIYLQMIETEEDRSKFEKIYLNYRGLMFHVAFEILQHEQDAEDAVHQAFLNVAENIKIIDKAVSPKTKSCLVTIVERRAIDIYRKKASRKEVSCEEIYGLSVKYSGSNTLAQCMAKLPARYRQFIVLRYGHGFTYKEVSKLLGITEVNARKLEQRSKEKLMEICKKEGLL